MFHCAKESQNNGFTMTFENGYTVSVRWGWANYCTNRTMPASASTRILWHDMSSTNCSDSLTAEVAVWNKDGEFVSSPGVRGDVQGHQSSKDVVAFLFKVSSWDKH